MASFGSPCRRVGDESKKHSETRVPTIPVCGPWAQPSFADAILRRCSDTRISDSMFALDLEALVRSTFGTRKPVVHVDHPPAHRSDK